MNDASSQFHRTPKFFYKLELLPICLSLVDTSGMRKNAKSVFIDNFNEVEEVCIGDTFNSAEFALDGGLLVHKVHLNVNETIDDDILRYVIYVKNNHSETNVILVFGGYYMSPNKSTEAWKRSR